MPSLMAVMAAIISFAVPAPSPGPTASASAVPAVAAPSPAASASPATTTKPSASAKPKASPTPSSPYEQMKWREVGPAATGGRVAAVAGSASDVSLYFIGTAGGGVWKSVNGGATWDPVFDDQDIQSIGAVTIAPSDNRTVWVGTGESNPRNDVMLGDGVYKSTDGGDSWKKMGLSDLHSVSRIAVDPTNINHVVVAGLGDLFKDSTAGGVYVTSDGGKSWTHSLYVGPSSGASDLAMDPNNPNVLYVGIWQFRRQPWTFTSGGPDDGLYKSTDGGATWAKLAGHGLPTGLIGRIGVAVAPSDSSRVYALIQSKEGFLFRSSDSGATWSMVSNDTLVDQRPFYFDHVAVDPKDKDHVYAVALFAAQSKDGGKTFKTFADAVHVDYHAIWIAPNDNKRMIFGEDGGAPITVDGGKNWLFSRNYAIGQIYHVAADNANPYNVCGGFQDNNGWCWPSNSRDSDGITNAYVTPVTGGDGEWIVPDPGNSDYVWTDTAGGGMSIWMNKSRYGFPVFPDFTCFNGFAYDKCTYRFNWDSPIAFAPWDPHTVLVGGNVVFQSRDEGRHFQAISPDLTLNMKAHQQPAGGPINYDVSSAENSDTILDIEGGALGRGVIWVGTDDGLIQLTRDGGKHWSNVTPAGVPPYGRVEIVAPSTSTDGTAFAVIDRHYSGDYTPYIFKTTNFGKSWTSIAAGLPKDQPARSVRQDPVNPAMIYAGLERSIWVSFNGGSTWKTLQSNLPHTAVFDIRFQPQFDDLIIGTHGRSAWIMDNIRPLQELEKAKAAGRYLFQPRVAYQYNITEKAEGPYTEYAANNPPVGAVIDFFQTKAGGKPPVIDFLDARSRVVHHYEGKHVVNDKKVPWVTNIAGINHFTWGFGETPITPWYGAASKNARQPGISNTAVPGTYTVRVKFSNGQVTSRPLVVKPDPDLTFTQADYDASYRFSATTLALLDRFNRTLNSIDAQIARLKKLHTRAATSAADGGAALEKALAADYKNGEDGIVYPPKIYEEVQGLSFTGGTGPPLAEELHGYALLKPQYEQAMQQAQAWLATARAVK